MLSCSREDCALVSVSDEEPFYWAESTVAAVVKSLLIALYVLLGAAALSLAARLRFRALLFGVSAAVAALSIARVAITAVPNSAFDEKIHTRGPVAYAVDTLPEALFFVAVWLLLAALALFARAGSASAALPHAAGANTHLRHRLGLVAEEERVGLLPRALTASHGSTNATATATAQLTSSSKNGVSDTWRFRARMTLIAAAAASAAISVVVVVVVTAIELTHRVDYERGRLFSSTFRGAMGAVATTAFAVIAVKYHERAFLAAMCGMLPLLKGVYGSIDCLVVNDRMRRAIGADAQSVVWGMYFAVTELVPLGVLVEILWKRSYRNSQRTLLASSTGFKFGSPRHSVDYRTMTLIPSV
eukprot:m51a1_g440 hypothetical protein (359) ;mRNA; r:77314-78879